VYEPGTAYRKTPSTPAYYSPQPRSAATAKPWSQRPSEAKFDDQSQSLRTCPGGSNPIFTSSAAATILRVRQNRDRDQGILIVFMKRRQRWCPRWFSACPGAL
jgi:hypothetical protein